MIRSLCALAGDILSKAADFERLENLVDKTQQDKRRLGTRINRLILTGSAAVF